MQFLVRMLKLLFLLIILIYVIVVGFLYFFQEALLFRPPPSDNIALPKHALAHRVITPDSVLLNVIELKASDAAPYVLFFHGNGSLAQYEIGRGEILRDAGFNVLLAEYRGYGGSGGSPAADNILADALVLHDWLKEKGAESIFVAGHSLGSGPATYLAANRDIKALVLEAPYSSLADVAAYRYPFAPVKLLFKHDIPSHEFIQNVSEPILIIHGTQDRVIPIKFGKRLFEYAKPIDRFVEMNGAGHLLGQFGSVERAIEFFNTHLYER